MAGSLREKSFGELWRSSPLFRSLREPALEGRCGECEYKELCGGCRARAFALNSDVLAEDPWCTYVPASDMAPRASEELPLSFEKAAEERLDSVPFFVRRVVRSAVEAFARKRHVGQITVDLMDEVGSNMGARMRGVGRPGFSLGKAAGGRQQSPSR